MEPMDQPMQPEPMAQQIIDDDTNKKLVEYARESRIYFGTQLKTTHDRAVAHWEKYYSKRPDTRDPITEKWRAHIVVPQAYFNVESKAAQMVEILMSADPPIQADPMFETREEEARGIEKLLDYTLRVNYFRKFVASQARAISVQGTAFFKSMWKKRSIRVPRKVTPQQLEYFQAKLKEAQTLLVQQQQNQQQIIQSMVPDWTTEPERFEKWRNLVNSAYPPLNLPPAPSFTGEPEEMLTFWGPFVEPLPFFQVFLNPDIQEIQDQPIVIHEYYKPRGWLTAHTGEESSKPFDPKRVQAAIDAWDSDSVNEQRRELSALKGIPDGVQKDPTYEHPVKLWEVWRLGSEYPFQVILNETQVINKDPRALPFEHGQNSIGMIRNVLVPGYAFGVSDIEPAFSLLEEQDIFRSLRLDKVTLHTLPVFKKLQGFGLAELQKKLTPGGIIEVSRMDGIQELLPGDVNPSAYSEANNISGNIDQTFGIDPAVRGNQATINRVPATESQNRLNQAQIRLKLNALQFEDDMNPHVGQWLGLWRQFGDVNNRPTVGGYDPLADIAPEKLTVALSQNYRFRGATQALSRELQAQQLVQFGKEFREMMLPTEMRELMRQVGLALGLRSLSKIISTEGDKLMMQSFVAQKQAEATQNTAATTQNQQISGAAEAPTEVEID